MAFQAIALLVMRHGDAAIDTLHRRAATAAQDGPGVPAAVDEHESLRFVGETFLNARMQLRGNWADQMRLPKLFAQVDDSHTGERAIGNAGSQRQ
jgi:hypothetical protein